MYAMKILVLGSTGMLGSRIVSELEHRGHQVTRGVRPGSGAPGTEVDPRVPASVAAAAAGHDAVVNALGRGTTGDVRVAAEAAGPLLTGLDAAGCPRLLVVGGAGSLLDRDGRRVVDGPEFPDEWKPASQAQIDALDAYRRYDGPVEWTYLSPSDLIEPGSRTGRIELGGDHLLRGEDGTSYVSAEDYAVALVDELENPAHPRRRFTVRSR